MSKTVLFGLDGADPELVKRWIDDLPNFRKVREDGFFGELESVRPPITVPAWICMLSSRLPRRLSSWDFGTLDFDEYEVNPSSADHFRGHSLIDDGEKRTISYRIPGTTPGYEINGDMVTGFVKGESLRFLPDELDDEIKQERQIALEELHGSEEQERQIALDNFWKNMDAFTWLLKNRDFDRAFSVFRMVDTHMHRVQDEDGLKESYLEADRALGRMIDLCQDNGWNLIVVSDHGSGTTSKKLYLNGWLYTHGYTTYHAEEEKESKQLLYRGVDVALRLGLKPVLKKLVSLVSQTTGKDLKPGKGSIMDKIDFEDSEAFSYLSAVSNYGAVWIHDTERFPDGIVEDRQAKAEEIREDLLQEDVIEQVWTNRDIFDSPGMPDLIVQARQDVVIGAEIYPHAFHETGAVVHNIEGLIGGLGPDFVKGKEIDAELIDIANTIEALDGEVTERDGRPLLDVLKRPHITYNSDLEV
jgi:predicted AlkP superfamily phosphohydrolase/phosphomutase